MYLFHLKDTCGILQTFVTMPLSQMNGSSMRANPFSRHSPSPSPGPQRPKSVAFAQTEEPIGTRSHTRTSSFSSVGNRLRATSLKDSSEASGTFAPKFIKEDEIRRGADQFRGLEGDNDFSGTKYVWIRDTERAFVKGQVVDEKNDGTLCVRCEDGTVSSCLKDRMFVCLHAY